MRVVGGTRRGLALAGLGKGDPAAHLRPTSDRVRESLFNVLASRFDAPVEGCVVLDLFAGTGAMGLEALSRGAGSVTFVETGKRALALIRDNCRRFGAECRVIARPAARIGPCAGPPAGLVFLDPPYGKGLGAPALAAALAGGWIAHGALIVWEEAAAQPAQPSLTLIDTRRYGDTSVTFLQADQRG